MVNRAEVKWGKETKKPGNYISMQNIVEQITKVDQKLESVGISEEHSQC